MKSVWFIVLVSFCSIGIFGQDAKPKNSIEENVLSLLTKWRNGDTESFTFPLPPLDKIKMAPVNGSYEGFGARITYSTSNLVITGLHKFSVEQLEIGESNINASALLTVPVVQVSSDKYKINGRALFIPISGSGAMKINLRQIQLNVSIQLRATATRMWVDDFRMSFRLSSLVANLDGGPSSVVVLLNTSGAAIIQSYHDDIVKTVRGLAMPAIDNFLAGNNITTTTQLFQLAQEVQAIQV